MVGLLGGRRGPRLLQRTWHATVSQQLKLPPTEASCDSQSTVSCERAASRELHWQLSAMPIVTWIGSCRCCRSSDRCCGSATGCGRGRDCLVAYCLAAMGSSCSTTSCARASTGWWWRFSPLRLPCLRRQSGGKAAAPPRGPVGPRGGSARRRPTRAGRSRRRRPTRRRRSSRRRPRAGSGTGGAAVGGRAVCQC